MFGRRDVYDERRYANESAALEAVVAIIQRRGNSG